MLNPRYRPLLLGLPALAFVWLLAWAGFVGARSTMMSADKIKAFVASVDLNKVDDAQRRALVAELRKRVDALPAGEWRKWSEAPDAERWFTGMNFIEKALFNADSLSNFNSLINNMRGKRRHGN